MARQIPVSIPLASVYHWNLIPFFGTTSGSSISCTQWPLHTSVWCSRSSVCDKWARCATAPSTLILPGKATVSSAHFWSTAGTQLIAWLPDCLIQWVQVHPSRLDEFAQQGLCFAWQTVSALKKSICLWFSDRSYRGPLLFCFCFLCAFILVTSLLDWWHKVKSEWALYWSVNRAWVNLCCSNACASI